MLHVFEIFLLINASASFMTMKGNSQRRYLRSTMTQQRFNHVLIPHVHKEKLDQLDLKSICSDFIAKNQSRKAFFGHE